VAIHMIPYGDTKVLTVTVAIGIVPVDLTGLKAAKFLIKRAVTDDDTVALITKTLGSGVTVTDAIHGVMQVALSATDTSVVGENLSCAVKIKDASDGITTVDLGTINLRLLAVKTLP